MTYIIRFEPERKLVRVTAEGTEDMTAALDAMRELHANPRFKEDFRVLCDLREQRFIPTATEAYGLGTLLEGFFSGQRFAFVIADAKHAMVQQQVLATAHAGADAKVFSDIEPAISWLEAT